MHCSGEFVTYKSVSKAQTVFLHREMRGNNPCLCVSIGEIYLPHFTTESEGKSRILNCHLAEAGGRPFHVDTFLPVQEDICTTLDRILLFTFCDYSFDLSCTFNEPRDEEY